MAAKHGIRLGEVQETLLIPLYMRALETQRPDAICRDEQALEIVGSIDYDFSKFDDAAILQLDIAIRTEILDEVTVAFMARHPDAIVVNLGAGLDGRFLRLDNGQVTWFDLDLPDVIELRRQFFTETARNRFLAKSFLEESWIDDLCRKESQPVLLLAEGVTPYLEERHVRELCALIATRLPGAEFVFQSISPNYVNRQDIVPAVNRTKAVFKWGITSGRELEKWDPRYEFLAEWAFIDRHRLRWWSVRKWWFLPPVYCDLRDVMKITYVRFRR